MAKKNRHFTPVPVPEAASPATPKARYEDQFQHTVGRRLEEAGKKLEGQGRNILYVIGAIIVIAILIWIFMAWKGRSNAAAQTALGKAIETSQAAITDTPPPAGSTQKTFKTEKERAEAAIPQFQAVIDQFGGAAGEKAKFFIAVNQLGTDRPTALSSLEGLSRSGGEVGTLAKFALANAKESDGQLDQAATLYQEMAAASDPIYSKDTINFELAKIYEKQGKKQEAVDLLFNMVKTGSELKDADGKAVPLSGTLMDAKDKLTELDAAKAKELPETAQDSPFGGPVGM